MRGRETRRMKVKQIKLFRQTINHTFVHKVLYQWSLFAATLFTPILYKCFAKLLAKNLNEPLKTSERARE